MPAVPIDQLEGVPVEKLGEALGAAGAAPYVKTLQAMNKPQLIRECVKQAQLAANWHSKAHKLGAVLYRAGRNPLSAMKYAQKWIPRLAPDLKITELPKVAKH